MLEILYLDEHICVINKPAGYVVHKTRGAGDSPVILQTLRDQIGKKIFPVHRLDRATSGCLAFALSSSTAKGLQEALQSELSQKKYQALCRGKLAAKGVFDRELSNEKKVKQVAITHYSVLKEYEDLTFLELEIKTGRKHQIRRHLQHEGNHIVGDVNYGKGWLNRRYREEYDFSRMFLHCHFLSFVHPVSNERIEMSCSLDDELSNFLKALS